MVNIRPCRDCNGTGKIIEEPCHKCHGKGTVKESKTINIKVPAGVETGNRLRVSGEGNAGEVGGGSGDLYVQIRVKPNKKFERDENFLEDFSNYSFDDYNEFLKS